MDYVGNIMLEGTMEEEEQPMKTESLSGRGGWQKPEVTKIRQNLTVSVHSNAFGTCMGRSWQPRFRRPARFQNQLEQTQTLPSILQNKRLSAEFRFTWGKEGVCVCVGQRWPNQAGSQKYLPAQDEAETQRSLKNTLTSAKGHMSFLGAFQAALLRSIPDVRYQSW